MIKRYKDNVLALEEQFVTTRIYKKIKKNVVKY